MRRIASESSPGSASTSEELTACKIGGCCGKDTPLLAHDALLARLPALPMWRLSPDRTAISKEFVAKNWAAAMAFFNAVSVIAEDEGHHPDLHLTGWRNVRVDLSTHAIGGLSLPDLVLAAKIDAIPTEYSPKWLREQEAARKREAEARYRAQKQVEGEAVEEKIGGLKDNPFKRRDSKAGSKENLSNLIPKELTEEQKEIAALKTSGVARERANSLGVQLTPRASKPWWQKCMPCFAPKPTLIAK